MTVLDLTATTSITSTEAFGIEADIRRWSLRAIALLSVLNFLDVVLTKTFVRAGLAEGNPLMEGLVRDWKIGTVKAIILGALFLKTATGRPSIIRACMLWLGVGVYLVVSYVNWQVIQAFVF